MTQIDLIQTLQKVAKTHHKKIFSLPEIAILLGLSHAAAGMLLLRAAQKGIVFRVKSTWINAMEAPSLQDLALALVIPSYVSFESALYHHNILSQSPRAYLSMATSGRSRTIETPLGKIRAIHLKQALFFGFDADRIAYPEKAWLDLIYLRCRNGEKGLVSEEFYLSKLGKKRLKYFVEKFPKWIQERIKGHI